MKRLRFYISPYYIIRGPLLKNIKEAVLEFDLSGKILDIGCGQMPYKNLFKNSKYEGIDFKLYSKNKDYRETNPDYYFSEDYLDKLVLPFKDCEFDHIVSFQVLEHHKNPETFIKEVGRVIKPEGKLLLSFPFIEGLHEEPNDFQRFTKYGIQRILQEHGFEVLKIKSQGKFFSVIYFLHSELLNIFASRNKFNYFIASIIYLLLFLPWQYLCLILDKLIKTDAFVINYMVVAKKNDTKI